MGRINDYLEKKIAGIVNSWDDATLEKHTLAKGDSALQFLNRPNPSRSDAQRRTELQMDPANFIYKSEILQQKAYFFNNPQHREIVFTHNTLMDAAIKKIKKAVTAVEPTFTLPNGEDEENPDEHEKATKGWKQVHGKDIFKKALEKSIKHGFILYEPLKIPEADLDWYTNAPFFIRAFDEIDERKKSKYGMYTQYSINPSNENISGYTIDITLNAKKLRTFPADFEDTTDETLHAGLFYDPDNTDDHNGRPWFLGCWDNVQDYEAIKEARNSYDEQIGNGFIVVGIPSKDYAKVKDGIKTKIKNIRREQGLVIPIMKDTPMAIEFKGSTFQVDFNADLDDIRRDIIANIGFPERWLFGDPEGAMESSGKDRMQVHDMIKQIFADWKRFIKLVLKYHGYIKTLDEVDVKAPYELQLTEAEKADIDIKKAQALDIKAQWMKLEEIRADLGKDPISEEEIFKDPLMKMEQENQQNNPNNPPDEAKTGPKTEKKDNEEIPYLLLDAVIDNTKYETLKEWWGVSRDTISKIKRNMRENKQTTVKTDSVKLDSVQLGPDLYASSGLIVPTQNKYYPEYKSNFIRSATQLSKAYDRFKEKTFPIGVYKSNGHDDGIEVKELSQFGEAKLEKVDDQGIYGTIVYDLSKVDEILGKNNWIRKRLKAKKKINTSVGLLSTDIPIDDKTKYEINHKIKSFVATEFPRNRKAGVD
jgi:hypothetical protein